ncbi:MAG: GNAT family N-acetyltransferase [Bacteroidales bacterium]
MSNSNHDLTFRIVPTSSDVEGIRAMVSGTGFFRPDEVEIAVELAEVRIKEGLKSGYHFILADVHSELAGYACFGLIPCSLLSWDLYWIVTKKEFQGKGIGGQLLLKAENEITKNGGKNIIIETSSKELYKGTQHFYDKYGYMLKARLEDFYDYGDDKLIYIKKLPVR